VNATHNEQHPFHPAADLFPRLESDAFRQLVDDIREHGQRQPIYRLDGLIIDGRNRLWACEELGIDPWIVDLDPADVGDPVYFVLSLNAHRRHLTIAQKRGVIKKALQHSPEKSDRQHARTLGVDHKTVGSVRAEAESTGEVPQLISTVGADGRERSRTVTTSFPSKSPQQTVAHQDDAAKTTEESTLAKKAEVCLDQFGTEIPGELTEVFAAKAEFDEQVRVLNKFLNWAKDTAERAQPPSRL
jgi:ParB-like chromosome segregation protein Spo0J